MVHGPGDVPTGADEPAAGGARPLHPGDLTCPLLVPLLVPPRPEMPDRPESRPRPGWLVKIMRATQEGMDSLTPEERAEAAAEKAARKARAEAPGDRRGLRGEAETRRRLIAKFLQV